MRWGHILSIGNKVCHSDIVQEFLFREATYYVDDSKYYFQRWFYYPY